MTLWFMWLVTVAAMAGVGLYRVFSAQKEKSRRRLIGTPRTLSNQLRPGIARVSGKVRRGHQVLRGPISDRVCVAFELNVELHDGHRWQPIFFLHNAVPFAIADEMGEALVDPGEHFYLLLEQDIGYAGAWAEEPAPQQEAAVRAILQKWKVRTTRGLLETERKIRFYESVLEDGDRASVYGSVEVSVHAEGERAGPRSPPVARLLRGSARNPMHIGDGRVVDLSPPPGEKT
jgi:hypothetical protein